MIAMWLAHYAYMVKIVQDVELMSSEDVVGHAKCDKAMDEKVNDLNEKETWDLVLLLEGKNVI